MRVAVFADIHGKFLLPFKLVHLYQQETGNRIDHILQWVVSWGRSNSACQGGGCWCGVC